MKPPNELPGLVEGFFSKRLVSQRAVSAHTISSYRDTFRLLFRFAEHELHRSPSLLTVNDLSTEFICSFLDSIERNRRNSARTRNLRLTCIRSFFRYVVLEAPDHAGLAQRVLTIPTKRCDRKIVGFLTRKEAAAILSAIDQRSWCGMRDYALLLTTIQTGLRLAEVTGLLPKDVVLGAGAYVRCHGKGRKERCTPLTRSTARVLRAWGLRQGSTNNEYFFPSARGGRLSNDAVQDLVAKRASEACPRCPSLRNRRITPHMLRHTAAMEFLHAGIDRALIAIWLGHESLETTQIYLDANLSMKEEILAHSRQPTGRTIRFKPNDRLLAFLSSL